VAARPRDRSVAVAQRVVNGTRAEVEAEVAHFMRGQTLEIRRRLPDRNLWVPATGLGPSLRRGLDLNKRIRLKGTPVTTCVVELPGDEKRVLVRFEIDFGRIKWGWRSIPISVGVATAAGVVVAAALGDPAIALITGTGGAAATGGAYAAASAAYGTHQARYVDFLERFLDELEGR
jgi:hypothetical protein